MAFGFNPRYQKDIEISPYNTSQFLALSQAALKALSWNIGKMTETVFRHTLVYLSALTEKRLTLILAMIKRRS